jgi:hypothetical protein
MLKREIMVESEGMSDGLVSAPRRVVCKAEAVNVYFPTYEIFKIPNIFGI